MKPRPARSSNYMGAINVVWIVVCIFFLDVAIGRIRDLQAAHLAVSLWRYLQAAFWVVLLGFWLQQAWSRWRPRPAGKS